MKKKLLLLLLITFNIASAQVPDWTWARNISMLFNGRHDLTAVDSDGNVYLTGEFNAATVTIAGTTFTNAATNGQFTDAYILKFDSMGTLLWSKQISTYLYDNINAVTTDSLGNVYIAGAVGNNITLGPSMLTGYGHFVAKLDGNGEYIWALNTGIPGSWGGTTDIKADQSGNVFIAGTTLSTAALSIGDVVIPADLSTRSFIAKLDANGTCLWGRAGVSAEANSVGSYGMSLATDSSGGAVVCGRFSNNTLSFGSIMLTKTLQDDNVSDMYIVKYDNNGNETWAYNVGCGVPSNTMGEAVAIDSDDNVYVGGSFPYTVHFGAFELTSVHGGQFYLAKYSPDGNCVWVRSSGSGTNGYTKIASVTTDSAGNIYTAGITNGTTIKFSSSKILNSLGSQGAFFIAKYDTTGTPLWVKSVKNITTTDIVNDIDIDSYAEDDLYIGGTFNTPTLQMGSILLTKSVSNFDLFVGRLSIAAPLGVPVPESNEVSVYPNPARAVVNITNLKASYDYSLYNILGTCVKKGVLLNQQETLDVNQLQVGLYILQLTDINGNTTQKKIIIE